MTNIVCLHQAILPANSKGPVRSSSDGKELELRHGSLELFWLLLAGQWIDR
jgi:hypothetical protein